MGTKFSMVKWQEFNEGAIAWDAALERLDGASLHQTNAWGEARKAVGWKQLRLAAYDNRQNVIALVQASLRPAGPGLALVWIPGGPAGDLSVCGSELKKVMIEATGVPLVFCRMNALRPSRPEDVQKLEFAGWKKSSYLLTTGLSLDYDLRADEPERMAAASANWRHNLRRSGKYGLHVERWVDPAAEDIMAIYRDMEALKGLEQQHSLDEIKALLASLGDRLILYRCKDVEGKVVALRGCGIFGKRGWDLLAAAAPPARKVYASHALFWALTSECKRLGVQTYDMSGVDPVKNKGVYDFKKGTGAAPMQYLGEWEWANVPGLRFVASLAMRYRKGGV